MRVRALVAVLALLACEQPVLPDSKGPIAGPTSPDAGEPASSEIPPLGVPGPYLTVDIPERFVLPELQKELPTYELAIPKETLDRFADDLFLPEQPATFRFEGATLPVMVELRGASARYFPKKSWNLDFQDLRFQGRRRIALIAEYQDCTMMTEKLAYDVLEALGVRAPRARYVRLVINGRYEGVFLDLEKVDKPFLKAHSFHDIDASIYRCGWKDCEMKTWKVPYQGDWKKKTNELEGDEELVSVLRAINHTPEPDLVATLERRLELEAYLRTMAMDALVSNNYIEDSESYFIFDRVTRRWSYVPWDLNNADARWWVTYGIGAKPPYKHPLVIFSLTDGWLETMYERRKDTYSGYLPVFSNLNTRIALHPELRERYVQLVEKAIQEMFNPASLHPRIDALHALLAPHMADDPYIDQAKFTAGRQWMRDFVSLRVPFVQAQLELLRNRRPALALSAVDPAQGWVELENYGAAPELLGGKGVTANLRKGLVRNLPSQTLAPGETLRLTASQLGIQLPPEGEVGLFNGESVAGMIDALFYGPLPPGRRYARDAGDPSRWTVQ